MSEINWLIGSNRSVEGTPYSRSGVNPDDYELREVIVESVKCSLYVSKRIENIDERVRETVAKLKSVLESI